MTDEPYRQWLAERRKLCVPTTLTDEIMRQVAELEGQRRVIWWLRVVQHIEHSRTARWAMYGGALAVGSLPFLFLARVAQLVTI